MKTLNELKVMSSQLRRTEKGHRAFTAEFKSELLEYGATAGIPIAQICQELGISASQYYQWKKQLEKGSGFREIALEEPENTSVEQSQRTGGNLKLISPFGFSLEGDVESICAAWRELHASVIR